MMWGTASENGMVIGKPEGLIDDDAREPFLAGLRDGIAKAGRESAAFIIDMSGIEHIGAAGLMALTLARKEAQAAGVRIALARPGPLIREILDIGRFGMIFDIVDDPRTLKA